ncbi:hypothetical protein PAAG_07403 [Paracoccidioides lutzii Pb01]|uniref:Uncharacterized protein n=1 Tax=Paracoccidioides lutzii (strain ATCC MYA-826 / Pb01) TaxID=502779 RepID=C1H9G2_PARBA|nr:hypothetical protein PAAG_07403 [Paracoccidioides lutzii Pb01]EEH36985.1 hypothetical protein PAAG_07403 [Paracoccidioides lutzii Pb01]
MPASTPTPIKYPGRRIGLATMVAAGFGYYLYTKSRAKHGRLIQPEERERYHAKGPPQTTEGSGKSARAKDIP